MQTLFSDSNTLTHWNMHWNIEINGNNKQTQTNKKGLTIK